MITRVVVYAIFLLYLLVGATYSGILDPQMRLAGVIGLAIGMGVWGVVRWHKRWRWHATALDGVILVWIAAFTLSLVANLETWRRIAIGLWYVGVYIGVWYVLHDLLANRAIRRGVLINALLLTGALVIAFGYLQVYGWITNVLPPILDGTSPFRLPRFVSTFGNANWLGAFLVVLLPLALQRMLTEKRVKRAVMAIYSLLLVGLLVLTFSRGAWVGAAAGVAIQCFLLLWVNGWLSPRRWLAWWQQQRPMLRILIVGLVLGTVAFGAALFLVRTPLGRLDGNITARLQMYDIALDLWSRQPLTGTGLFTYGSGLAESYGSPPRSPLAHAHNLILNVAAELGILGVIAIGLTIWFCTHAFLHSLVINRDPALIAGAAGFTAFAVHHLFDVPSTNPAIALTGLTVLVIASAPVEPVLITGWRQATTRVSIGMGGLVLVVSGMWSASIYSRYTSILYDVSSSTIAPVEGAKRLQSVIDADPAMPVYHYQQGMLYGLAGDEAFARASIDSFTTFLRLEPSYAIGWMNLSALYERLGDPDRAFAFREKALERATSEWTLWYQQGEYLEAIGNDEAAYLAYRAALRYTPNSRQINEFGYTPAQYRLMQEVPRSPGAGEIMRLLETGEHNAARWLWESTRRNLLRTNPTIAYSLEAILALVEQNRDKALIALSSARLSSQRRGDNAWVYYVAACIADFDGDGKAAQRELDAARSALALSPSEVDWGGGLSIAYYEFLRLALPRQFLPEADYAIVSPLLRYLLAKPEPCLF